MIDGAGPTIRFVPDPETERVVAFSDLPSLLGSRFTGGWWSVDAERLTLFESATYTNELENPWPVGNFPSRLVEGFHLVGLLEYMMNSVLHPQGPHGFGWNYGLDRVRFVSPVKTTDRIRLTGTLASIKPKHDGFLVRQDCVVQVEGRERPGLVAEWWVFWLPSPPAA